jgi:hypothetical protein
VRQPSGSRRLFDVCAEFEMKPMIAASRREIEERTAPPTDSQQVNVGGRRGVLRTIINDGGKARVEKRRVRSHVQVSRDRFYSVFLFEKFFSNDEG